MNRASLWRVNGRGHLRIEGVVKVFAELPDPFQPVGVTSLEILMTLVGGSRVTSQRIFTSSSDRHDGRPMAAGPGVSATRNSRSPTRTSYSYRPELRNARAVICSQ